MRSFFHLFAVFLLTAEPPTAVNCVSLTKPDDAYEVDADHGAWGNYNGFCRVLSQLEIKAGDPYTMTVQLLNVISSSGMHFGHPGVMYKVIDEDNFDLIYFRFVSCVCCGKQNKKQITVVVQIFPWFIYIYFFKRV